MMFLKSSAFSFRIFSFENHAFFGAFCSLRRKLDTGKNLQNTCDFIKPITELGINALSPKVYLKDFTVYLKPSFGFLWKLFYILAHFNLSLTLLPLFGWGVLVFILAVCNFFFNGSGQEIWH
jgi:hypothetical protein